METLAPLLHALWERLLTSSSWESLVEYLEPNDATAGPLLAPGPGGQAAPSSHHAGWHLQHIQTVLWLLVEQPQELGV